MRRVIVLLAAIGSAWGCATEPAGDLSGIWVLTESVMSETGISCTTNGELLISQSSNGNRFTGQRSRTASCTGAPQGFDIDGVSGIIGGNISGTDIEMSIDFCDFEGTYVSDTEMSGTFVCPDGLSQELVEFTGTWEAMR